MAARCSNRLLLLALTCGEGRGGIVTGYGHDSMVAGGGELEECHRYDTVVINITSHTSTGVHMSIVVHLNPMVLHLVLSVLVV